MIAIKDNIAAVELQISSACQHAKRNANEVTLLAVSKTKPIELLEQAYSAGQRNFGESYVQEAVEKITALQNKTDITWHFIGPIQTNKTKLIASHFSWVHSVDRIKVAKRLNEHRSGQDTVLNICLQVNISGELSKSGVLPQELPALLAAIENCDNLCLRGLMAIPEKNASQASFIEMQNLFLKLKKQYLSMDTLSMGMSADLQLAINAGSTMVRIGSAIFGARS
ncbi:YggS family pyridoxal phosphate-dependent enzyme [Cognaticolwellia beringensis]|uniref:Pyridoxal phosphate homeostasis protein n=1 Tax=Cognaticolwellia beringensis TaxID=1967665 RepID=A0A222G511_9GAMM|nr:YggS family pyridoxal phosphate-dependent enzyme [Cognaticolwellia beringensis]ASP46996.1 YggS family pyridoxal phosphate-dependent enzyme [Cognaticolwellia beringensis]